MVTSQPKAYGRREHRVCCRRAWRDRAAAVYAATAAYTGSQPPVVESSNVGSSISASTPSSSCNIDISATPLSKKMKLIQKHTVSSQSHPDLRLRDQIKAYIRCEPEGEDDDPLSFWRSNSSKFSLLQELARDTLSQSASSVPVENMFSTMGLLLNGKRSALGRMKFERL